MSRATSPSERILGSDAAVAVGRFSLAGVIGYRAKSGGPLRRSRVEAENDHRRYLERRVLRVAS